MSNMNKSFQKYYAKYYDVFCQEKDTEKECNFLEEIFKRFLRDKPRKILDIACGTGRHAIILAKRGYKVVGVDISEDMIEIAKAKSAKEKSEIKFYVMDMRQLHLNEKFDVCISMYESIDYILKNEEIKKTFSKIREHLNKGGLFIFDVKNGISWLKDFVPTTVNIYQNGNRKIIRIANKKLNVMKHIREVNYKCYVIEDNKIIDEFEETHLGRFFFPEEIKFFLQESGFEVVGMFPFLNLNEEINERTRTISVIARAV